MARQLQGARQPGQPRAEREDRGEQAALVDAECRRQLAILRGGAHLNPPVRALEQPPQPPEDGRADDDQEQVVGRQLLPEDVNRALEAGRTRRSEEHTSELQSLMRISYAVFCLKKKKTKATT